MGVESACRICDSKDLSPVLDLGLQPWANNFLSKEQVGKEPLYPLRLLFCELCACVQLDYTVPKEVMFSDHTYVSGTTKTLSEHFKKTASYVNETFFKHYSSKRMLDIGSNDGTQIEHYQALGFDVLGVESCKRIADQALKRNLPTVVDYFNEDCANTLGRQFDLINASGVFFHLEELHSAARAVKQCLAPEGVFVVQFLYMKNIVENLAFDQIYHEHLLYYTLATIENLLGRHDLEAFDAYVSPIHGGSVILFAGHKGSYQQSKRFKQLLLEEQKGNINCKQHYLTFATRVEQMRDTTLAYLNAEKSESKSIFGFGAPVKGNTFLNYCKIGTELVDCLVERNPLRRGLFSPGMHIPIVLEDEIQTQPDVYLVLAWNFKEEILVRNAKLVEKGVRFYFPVNPSTAENNVSV